MINQNVIRQSVVAVWLSQMPSGNNDAHSAASNAATVPPLISLTNK